MDASDLQVVALLKDGRPVEVLGQGDEGVVILDRTPFYAESGGQVGDVGMLTSNGVVFDVADTLKYAGQFHGHTGKLSRGSLKLGDRVAAAVYAPRRLGAGGEERIDELAKPAVT